MILLDDIVEDYQVKKTLMSLPGIVEDTEMGEHDSAFLCGLLNQVHPKKILEVGVAGGGQLQSY